MPATPKQKSGTAANQPHYVPSEQTKSTRGATGQAPGKGAGELPADSPHVKAAKETKTGLAPEEGRFDDKTSKRLASAASATSDVYVNTDGSYTRRVYANPVNFKAADGSWQPIDTRLDKVPSGRLNRKANALGVDFAGGADDANLASLQVDSKRGVSYRLQGARPVAAAVSGSTAMYSQVMADTDLVLESGAAGIKESLVLRSADAPKSWVFPMKLKGLTPRLTGSGSVELVDSSGTVATTVPAGFMQDSSFNRESGGHAESMAVRYELVTVDGDPALKVTADEAWLRDKARVYPVTVDPSFWATGSTFAQSGFSGDHSAMYEMRTGTYDGGTTKARSFLQFANFGSSYGGNRVTSATLSLFDIWAYTCAPKPFTINQINQSWTPSSVTSWPGPAIGGELGSVSADPGPACTNTSLNPGVGKWMWDPLESTCRHASLSIL